MKKLIIYLAALRVSFLCVAGEPRISQLIVAVPSNLGSTSMAVQDGLFRVISQLPPQTRVRMIHGIALTNIAIFEMPALNHPSQAAIAAKLAPSLSAVKRFLSFSNAAEQHGGVDLAGLFRQLALENLKSEGAVIVIVGSPYWGTGAGDNGWATQNTRSMPSDPCLMADPRLCPFGLGELTNRLKGLQVVVVPLGEFPVAETEALRQLHAKIASLAGGELRAFDRDVNKVLSYAYLKELPRPIKPEPFSSGPCRLLLISKPVPDLRVVEGHSSLVDLSGRTNVVIQAKWVGSAAVDIDMHFVPTAGTPPVSWKNKVGPGGIHFIFDDTKGGENPQAEHITIPATVNLGRAKLFLNCFSGYLEKALPVTITVTRLGIVAKTSVILPAGCRGNQGAGWDRDAPVENTAGWVEVQLPIPLLEGQRE